MDIKTRKTIKNFILSAVVAYGILYIVELVINLIVLDKKLIKETITYTYLGIGVLLNFIAFKIKTNIYKNIISYFLIIILVFLLKFFAVWAMIFEFLQIKDGVKELKK